jgi:DNA processing protein
VPKREHHNVPPLLPDAERIAALRLIRSENVGPVTFRDLIEHYGSAEAAIAALPELSARGGRGRSIRVYPRAEAEAELERAQRFGARVLVIGDGDYPQALAAVDAPPPVLLVKGDIGLLQRPIIGIVGSRQCSAAGATLAWQFAAEIGRGGFVIGSGLARGIDAAAHRAALDTGTIAVLAGGLDFVYPPEHGDLQREISERGLILSEMPFGFVPRAQDFPRRNRIVSGLSLGVLIVEAARRSGSLVTARLAAEQGREVFAVPGHPLDPRAEGTNKLLKSGATLVTEAADVLSAVTPLLRHPVQQLREPSRSPAAMPIVLADNDRDRVLSALGPAPVDTDSLARSTGLAVRSVQVALMELALAGRVERHGGGLVSLCPAPE